MTILGVTASSILKINASFDSIVTATGNNSSSLTISSIPADYKHLQLRICATNNDSSLYISSGVLLRFNSDTGANYNWHQMWGSGAASGVPSANGGTNTNSIFMEGVCSGGLSVTKGCAIIDIFDYSSTSKNKVVRAIAGYNSNSNFTGRQRLGFNGGVWRSNSAITSITFIENGSFGFTNASRFALYGIKG